MYAKAAHTPTIAGLSVFDNTQMMPESRMRTDKTSSLKDQNIISFLRIDREGVLIHNCWEILALTINITKSIANSTYFYILMEQSNIDFIKWKWKKMMRANIEIFII